MKQERELVNAQIAKMDTHIGEAANAATAMRDLVDATNNVAGRQLRAYVFLEGATFEQPPQGQSPFPPDFTGNIVIGIKNYGVTPATSAIVKTERMIGAEKDSSVVIPLSDRAKTHAKITIGPSQFLSVRIEVKDGGWQVAEWARLGNVNQKTYLFGRIDYVDAFENTRWTTFQMIGPCLSGLRRHPPAVGDEIHFMWFAGTRFCGCVRQPDRQGLGISAEWHPVFSAKAGMILYRAKAG